VIAISLRPSGRKWGTVSFASTLHLVPVLDLLLAEVPPAWQDEVRLGLQEALVNASKHGNNLDPSKTVLVKFSLTGDEYSWVISDQGQGFKPVPKCDCQIDGSKHLADLGECGRGLYILYQIFDQVCWNQQGNELRLCKQINHRHLNLRGTPATAKLGGDGG
jgi:anti-sigma regulatory factor (Ser/Thr protein kinase)